VKVGMPGTAGFATTAFLSNQCLERIWVKLYDLSQSANASEHF
jgi:hypothetical protein